MKLSIGRLIIKQYLCNIKETHKLTNENKL